MNGKVGAVSRKTLPHLGNKNIDIHVCLSLKELVTISVRVRVRLEVF